MIIQSSNFWELDDLKTLIEETFDTCNDRKDEIRWIICLLRGLMNIPTKRIEYHIENYKLRAWQYQLNPIIEKYKRKWNHTKME